MPVKKVFVDDNEPTEKVEMVVEEVKPEKKKELGNL